MPNLNRAMNAGVTGLQAQASQTSTVGANLSVSQATAAKREKMVFLPLVTGNNSTAGVENIMLRDMSQGPIEPDNSPTSCAISGNGFFVVARSAELDNPNQEYVYTRDGGFIKDKNGNLKTSSGYYLMGEPVDQNGNVPAQFAGTLTELNVVNISNVKPYYRPTDSLNFAAALPSSVPNGTQYNSNVPIVDSLGQKHNLTIHWTKTGPMTWSATVDCEHTTAIHETNALGPTPYSISIEFETDGSLKYIDGQAANYAPDIHLIWDPTQTNSNATNATVSFNFGTFGDKDGLSVVGNSFVPTTEAQDGIQTGNFINISINAEGLVYAHFSNGGSTPIYQIFLSNFDNPGALNYVGSGNYVQTTDSGDYSLRKPKDAGLGSLVSHALESSNVDGATEFTTLIRSQSAYSMNAQVIQASNEMLALLQNIKR